jgi:hypothetical protein
LFSIRTATTMYSTVVAIVCLLVLAVQADPPAAYGYNCGDLPLGISRPFAYSQFCTVPANQKHLVFGAGMNGYTVTDHNHDGVLDFDERIGDLLPLVPDATLKFGYNPSNRIRRTVQSINETMACTGADIKRDLVYLDAKFSTLSIRDVVNALSLEDRRVGFNQWRGILNGILREFIPEPYPLPSRTLHEIVALVDLDTVELTPVWAAPTNPVRDCRR